MLFRRMKQIPRPQALVLSLVGLGIFFTISIIFAIKYSSVNFSPETEEILPVAATGKPITWVDFDLPAAALEKAMDLDLSTHGKEVALDWIELLAYLGAKYGGDFSKYKGKDLDLLAQKLQNGTPLADLTKDLAYYSYYHEAYTAVLGEFLGEYTSQSNANDGSGGLEWRTEYGLKVYSPIAGGYYFDHYEDFCAQRTYGYDRKHLGHDLMCSVGTPIVAVESGIVEELGWNQYGGWRVGIRSFDRKRYYYYAHMRQNRPYHPDITLGAVVKAGDVIGYVGKTGYSTVENTNGMTVSHLHWGMQLIFDESQKDGPNEIWIDLYAITELLLRHKSFVFRDNETKEYYRRYDFLEPNLFSYGHRPFSLEKNIPPVKNSY